MCCVQASSITLQGRILKENRDAAASGTAFVMTLVMETLLDLGSSALTVFGSAFSLGTILLVGFVRVCSLSGLVSSEETQGTLREFLKNFS